MTAAAMLDDNLEPSCAGCKDRLRPWELEAAHDCLPGFVSHPECCLACHPPEKAA